MLGVYKQFLGRRASRGTREGGKKLVEKTEKPKHEEEHVGPTLNTGSRLKISIEDLSWERVDDGSTLDTEEPEQQEIVYITSLEDGLQNDGTKLYDEEGPNEKTCCEK